MDIENPIHTYYSSFFSLGGGGEIFSLICAWLHTPKGFSNKNDNIHKNEVQEIRWSDDYWQI